jgi:hypothetical protein
MIRRILDRIGGGMVGCIARVFKGKVQASISPHFGNGVLAASPGSARKISRPILFAGLVWLTVIVSSTFLMLAYANSPGAAGSPPGNWPVASNLPRDNSRPALVMFVHPRCPCSRASMDELALLMAHCQGRVNAHVFFLKPAEKADDWAHTDLWREAAAIPGVTVHQDDAGSEARLFNVETSGDLLLYDAKGRLIFHGGITSARGHSGDNAGRSNVQALLLNQPAQLSETPIFGCSLFECRSQTNQ